MEGAVGNSMTSLGTVFSWFTTQMGAMVDTITAEGNEILLLAIGIFVAGAVIGLARRLIGG